MSLDVELTVQLAETIAASRYAELVALSVLVWDHMLTCADEWDLIRNLRLGPVKIFFLFNRKFVPIVFVINMLAVSWGSSRLSSSRPRCSIWIVFISSSEFLTLAIWNYMFSLRIATVWGTRKFSGRLIWFSFAIYCITTPIALGLILSSKLRSATFQPDLHVCVHATNKWDVLVWGIMLAYSLLLLLMTAIRALRSRELHSHTFPMSPLMRKFYLDGIIYFFLVALLALASILTLLFASASFNILPRFFIPVVVSIGVSRLVFNMRTSRLYHVDQITGLPSVSTLPTPSKLTFLNPRARAEVQTFPESVRSAGSSGSFVIRLPEKRLTDPELHMDIDDWLKSPPPVYSRRTSSEACVYPWDESRL